MLFLFSWWKNFVFTIFVVVLVCPPIFALTDVLFCDIDDYKSYIKITLCADYIEERKTKNPL